MPESFPQMFTTLENKRDKKPLLIVDPVSKQPISFQNLQHQNQDNNTRSNQMSPLKDIYQPFALNQQIYKIQAQNSYSYERKIYDIMANISKNNENLLEKIKVNNLFLNKTLKCSLIFF